MYALHSWMDEFDYTIEPEVECPDNDPNDVAFVWATASIRGHDAIEEYIACKIYPVAASVGFETVPLRTTPVLKVETPWLLHAVGTIAVEHADQFLVEVETKVEKVLGSFGPREYDALRVANNSNGHCLNRVLQQMGVSYFPHPQPSLVSSQSANKK
jgi:hypothetical protein